MSEGEVLADQRCPECSAPLVQSEPRFSRWCRGCDWNVDPQEQLKQRKQKKPPGRLVKLRWRMEDRLAEQLYAGLSTRPIDRARKLDLATVTSIAIAVVVHLFTLGLLVLAGWIAYVGWQNPVAWTGIVLLPAIAFLMRPRFPKLDKHAEVVSRDQLPQLHALVERLCGELRIPRLDRIVLDTSFNASAGLVGLRQHRVLTIGLPLWNVLTPQERVAVLGHEFGHFVNADVRRGMFVGTAMQALYELDDLFNSGNYKMIDDNTFAFLQPVARGIGWVVSLPARVTLVVLILLSLRSGQRAEYLADQLAARAAGSEGAVRLLRKLMMGQRCMETLAVQVRKTNSGRSLWELERSYLADFPALERERVLRAAARERAKADDTHPPTHLRIKLAETPERHVPPTFVLNQAEVEAIELELKPWYDKLEKELRGELLRAMYQ